MNEDDDVCLRVHTDGDLYIGDVKVGGKSHPNAPGHYWLLPLYDLQRIANAQQQRK